MNLKIVCPCAVFLLVGLFRKYYTGRKRSFYERLTERKLPPIYIFKLGNVHVEKSIVKADLINRQSKKVFQLKISFINEDVIRFYINDPIYRRYKVKDAVDFTLTEIDTINENEDFISINHTVVPQSENEVEENKKVISVKIDKRDFKVEILVNDTTVAWINLEHHLYLEEYPQKGVIADIYFPEAYIAYGLPERADQLSLNTKGHYKLFNEDRAAYPAYGNGENPLYGSIPILYAHGLKGTTGILWLNASETHVNLDQKDVDLNAIFMSESGALNFFILTGPSLRNCVKQNAKLTGVSPLPPQFSLGYHQSRYSYMSEEEVFTVCEEMELNDFPMDTIWLDIEYTDGKKYFTWNRNTFPDDLNLMKRLKELDKNVVAIIDPHIKTDPNYFVYSESEKRDYLIKNPNQTVFKAACWPGQSSWIDFFNPEARKYYAGLYKDFVKTDNLFIWNDMNEPAIFEMTNIDLLKHLKHYGNWRHKDVHNQYGFYNTMATHEGLLLRQNVRPFILTRSFFVGNQKFAAVWTGDNLSEWDHLRVSIPMCLTLSLAGLSFCGADVGGFLLSQNSPDSQSKEFEYLIARWYQLGAWLPFFRGHCDISVPHREPYLFNHNLKELVRAAIKTRYRHLPYWYTLFWNHEKTGEPVIRPLVYQYPWDKDVWTKDNEFLVGPNILVYPITWSGQNQVDVYLPGDSTKNECWYYLTGSKTVKVDGYNTLKVDVEEERIPIFYRGGSIVTVKETVRMSTKLMQNDPVSLNIFLGNSQEAGGELYVDDGISFDYKKDCYAWIQFGCKADGGKLIFTSQCLHNGLEDRKLGLATIWIYGSVGLGLEKARLKTNNDNETDKELTVEVDLSINCLKICDINAELLENVVIELYRDQEPDSVKLVKLVINIIEN